MTTAQPQFWIVAGPNGVGKTTYAFRHIKAVSGSTRFVNLDEIARGLSPLDPSMEQQRAARVALELTRSLIADQRSFSIETTLSGKTHLRTIEAAREAGFVVNLLYFLVASPDISLARIARRVSEGGHDVAEADVRRRFERSIANLPAYIGTVDQWRVFDNATLRPKVIAEGRRGCASLIEREGDLPQALWAVLESLPPCKEG
ncbi:AAA family ATPase [Bosea sp. NBC_00550]|uniref:AAA family ATPase n=1 Tax=Bosea sp. NBC_00550 TaxID=2969621 RepID=UPI0022326FD3|nr:AAA family ATPase [Bosea sp. NBC_00550]UZF90341.1 AAA family ATPase [Bosea sp. NBC_00550]